MNTNYYFLKDYQRIHEKLLESKQNKNQREMIFVDRGWSLENKKKSKWGKMGLFNTSKSFQSVFS